MNITNSVVFQLRLIFFTSMILSIHGLYGCLNADRLTLPEKPFGMETPHFLASRVQCIEALKTLSPELIDHISKLCAMHSILRNESNEDTSNWLQSEYFSAENERKSFVEASNGILKKYSVDQGMNFLLIICVLNIPDELLQTQMNALMQQYRNLGENVVAAWPQDVRSRYIKFYEACNTDNWKLMRAYLKTGGRWTIEWVLELALRTVLSCINPLLGKGLTIASNVRTVINASIWVIKAIDERRAVDHKYRYFKTSDGALFLMEMEVPKEAERSSDFASKEYPHELLVPAEQFIKIVQLLRELRHMENLSSADKTVYFCRYHPGTLFSCLSSIKDVHMANALTLVCQRDDWNFLEQLQKPLQCLPTAAGPSQAEGPFNQICTALSLSDTKTKLLFARALAERWKMHASLEGANIVFFQKHGWWRSLTNLVPSLFMRLFCRVDSEKEL